MKRYIEIQNEVLKDFKVNLSDLDIVQKNSKECTYNLFFKVGMLITKNESISLEFADELVDKYNMEFKM